MHNVQNDKKKDFTTHKLTSKKFQQINEHIVVYKTYVLIQDIENAVRLIFLCFIFYLFFKFGFFVLIVGIY
jgi:hypothetical protein